MMNAAAVNEALLKKLSQETQLVGKLAILKGSEEMPEQQAVISNVIIMPQAPAYRNLFMRYYHLYKQNAVKALKELLQHVPYTPAYELDVAYILSVPHNDRLGTESKELKIRSEFMFPEDLAAYRQKLFSESSKVFKK